MSGPIFLKRTGDLVATHQMALQSLDKSAAATVIRTRLLRKFVAFGVLAATLTFRVLLIKRSDAEKGTHVAAE